MAEGHMNATPSPRQQQQGGGDGTVPICRKFIWGICNKFSQCKFRHELNIEAMKNLLKFCHDFQNKPFCDRPHCTFLHATKEEEALFRSRGILPKVLADRHAALAAASAVPIYLPPPPPPPPPLAPPPPPPPEPATALPAPHIYPVQTQTLYPGYMQQAKIPQQYPTGNAVQQNVQHLLPAFDPSRPPPTAGLNGATKRPGGPIDAAGPTKRAKGDCHGLCEDCIRRQKRIEAYKRDIDRMLIMEADKRYLIKQKEQQIEKQKQLLLNMVPPEQRRLLEFYIEGTPLPESNSNSSNTSSIPTTVVFQLLKFLLNNAPNSDASINQHPATPRQPTSRLDGADTPRATTAANQEPFTPRPSTSDPRPVLYHPSMPPPAYYGAHGPHSGHNAQTSAAGSSKTAAPQYPSYYTPYYHP